MTEAPSAADSSSTTSVDDVDVDSPVRSTTSVLMLICAILLIPIVALVIAFGPFRGSSGKAGSAITDSLDPEAIHAIYLSDNVVYFGFVGEARGDFFVLEDAFYLRSTEGDDAADAKDDEKREPTLAPVPVSAEVGGDGNVLVNGTEVLRVQTLTEDSSITKAIDIDRE